MTSRTSNRSNTRTTLQALKSVGISNPADRRAFIEGRNITEKVKGILENNPEIQDALDHTTGIGDAIIDNLHEVMDTDFQESDILLQSLVEFFQVHGKLWLNIYDINNQSVRTINARSAHERIQNLDVLFWWVSKNSFTNEKNLLQENINESSKDIESAGWKLCFKIKSTEGITYILSFGNKNTPRTEILKIQKLFKKTWLLKRITEKLNHIQVKYTDHLTGLYNKQYIQSVVEKNTPYSVVFLDLDRFKEYNDTRGHEAWDILLKEVATMLQSSVRYNDKVCRVGWDEFMMLIDTHDANKEIDKIRTRIKEKVDAFNKDNEQKAIEQDIHYSPLSISSWHAIWDISLSLEDIMRRADKDMFRCKAENGNEWTIYRVVDKISKLPLSQQKEIIDWLLAINPELINDINDLLVPTEIK